MRINTIIVCVIIVLASFKSNSQTYQLEVSNQVFRNALISGDELLFDYKGTFNINSRLVISRSTNFGSFYAGIGYTTFNYITEINIDEFDSPTDPAFSDLYEKQKSKGHSYISIPIGIRKNLNDNLFVPLGVTLNLELENKSGLFQKHFLGIDTGIGYNKSLNEKMAIAVVPTFSVLLNATRNSNIKMPLMYGLRLNLNYKL